MKRQHWATAMVLVVMTLHAGAREMSLVDAAKGGDLAQVKALLQRKTTDVNQGAVDGTTALHWAVNRNDQTMVDLLIHAGADVRKPNRYGLPPVALAAVNGNAAILTLLIKAGADPNTAVRGGETLLMTAARTGDPGALKALLIAGAQINTTDEAGQTALMWAAAADNAAAIRVLTEAGADLKLRTKLGVDAFMFAVRGGQLAAAAALLEAGADVNAALSTGESALAVALINANWEMASILIDRGANPNRGGAGYTALHRLVLARRPGRTENPALPTGNIDSLALARKMIAKGVDVNARMSKDAFKDGPSYAQDLLIRVGATAFLLAAKTADVDLLKVLLAAGADPNIPAFDGTTPLMVAAGLRSFGIDEAEPAEILETVKMCLQLGNKIDAVNDAGETPLHGAAYQESSEVAHLLIQQGAALDVKDKNGLTPLAVASGIYYHDKLFSAPDTAAELSKAMGARALRAELTAPDEKKMCLYCFQTRPETYAAQQALAKKLETAFAGQPKSQQ